MTWTFTAAALLATTVVAFSPTAKNNVAVYWGQGPYQERLVETCKNSNIDIVNVAFINVFPDQGAGGYPGSNFGNACGAAVYSKSGQQTQLLKNCRYIGPDIKTCQKKYGKKILLSLGGGVPNNQYLVSDRSAQDFANFLWGAFGPQTSAWVKAQKPRPFGSAVVDGFDFDIESENSPPPSYNGRPINDYKTRGYGKMITTFRKTLFPRDRSKKYYISAAPQCVVPDSHFGSLVKNYWFDFLFVQFYNTPQCSARTGIQHMNGKTSNDISFPVWNGIKFHNKNVRIYLGLPARTDASGSASFYLQPSELQRLVKRFYSDAHFGGVMLWEATRAKENVVCGHNYATWAKKILNAKKHGQALAAPSSNSKCNGRRDVQNTPGHAPALLAMTKRQVESPLAPMSTPLSTAVPLDISTTLPVPAPASPPTSEALPTSVDIAAVAPAVPVSTPEAVNTTSDALPIAPVTTPSSLTDLSTASPVLVSADNATQANPVAVADATTSPVMATATVQTTSATIVSSLPGNATQAKAQAAVQTGNMSEASMASTTNTTGNARARVFAASDATTSITASDSISATESATATADAADTTITSAPTAARIVNGTADAQATVFLTKTLTNVVYETMSTCVPTVTDCAKHPESQTVVYVTSTVDVVTTVYVSGEPAPTPKTLYSSIYNTIQVYYASNFASASPSAGLNVDAKLFNPHADDETTTITLQSTVTIFATATVHASRTTSTLTSFVTVYPLSADSVAAADKVANAASGFDDSSSDADSNESVSDSAPAANVRVTAQDSSADNKPAVAQTFNAAPAPYAIPANNTDSSRKIAAVIPAQRNTNATGFNAAGLDPARAYAVQAKAAGNMTDSTTGNTAGRVEAARWMSAIVGLAVFALW